MNRQKGRLLMLLVPLTNGFGRVLASGAGAARAPKSVCERLLAGLSERSGKLSR